MGDEWDGSWKGYNEREEVWGEGGPRFGGNKVASVVALRAGLDMIDGQALLSISVAVV